jgi:formate/nitrite transporter FocA (FNT family)
MTEEMRGEDIPSRCTAHSGMDSKLSVNLFLNTIGTILLAYMITLALSIQSSISVNTEKLLSIEKRVEKVEKTNDLLRERINVLELSR